MKFTPLIQSLRRGWLSLGRRWVVVTLMALVPFGITWFFINMMDSGLPMKVPAAVVDLDQSALSRKVTRNLASSQALAVDYKAESFHEAIDDVRAGKIFG